MFLGRPQPFTFGLSWPPFCKESSAGLKLSLVTGGKRDPHPPPPLPPPPTLTHRLGEQVPPPLPLGGEISLRGCSLLSALSKPTCLGWLTQRFTSDVPRCLQLNTNTGCPKSQSSPTGTPPPPHLPLGSHSVLVGPSTHNRLEFKLGHPETSAYPKTHVNIVFLRGETTYNATINWGKEKLNNISWVAGRGYTPIYYSFKTFFS